MRIPCVLLVLLLVAGCDTTEDDGLLRRVAFEEGDALRYESTFATGSTPDSLTVAARDTFAVRIADLDATVGGVGGLVEMEYRHDGDAASIWYRQRRDALEEIAYESGLVLAGAPALRVGGAFGSPIAAGSGWATGGAFGDVTFREPPRIVVRYPAEVGDSWTHWRLEDVGLELTDYVGERGLVRRVGVQTQVLTDEHGNPIGTFVTEERRELIAVEG